MSILPDEEKRLIAPFNGEWSIGIEEEDCESVEKINHPLGFICIGIHEKDIRMCLRRSLPDDDHDAANVVFSSSVEKTEEIIKALVKAKKKFKANLECY